MLEDINRDITIENNNELKYEYKMNMNTLAGIIKDEFIAVLMCEDTLESVRKYKQMVEWMKKYVVPIKLNRAFSRRMHSMNKYRSNLRRNI